jgi:hypothetical protein
VRHREKSRHGAQVISCAKQRQTILIRQEGEDDEEKGVNTINVKTLTQSISFSL